MTFDEKCDDVRFVLFPCLEWRLSDETISTMKTFIFKIVAILSLIAFLLFTAMAPSMAARYRYASEILTCQVFQQHQIEIYQEGVNGVKRVYLSKEGATVWYKNGDVIKCSNGTPCKFEQKGKK